MAYLGNAPTSVPLSSADILDSSITSAKIANSTIAIADFSATGTPSASTFLRGDNVWGSAGASAGTIIQVVQTIKTDTFSGNSTSYVDVTGLSATITPSSASNKVLVLVNLSLTDQHGSGGGALLLRGSTAIGQADTAGSRRRSSFSGSGYTGDGAGENNMQMSLNSSVLDSPATTSATTYKVQIVSNGGNYYGVNLTVSSGAVNDPDNSDSVRMVSSITLMEVKG
jgi:hypothetical protein